MDAALIDEIVARVVAIVQERLMAQAPSRRVLMLFSGASTGYVVGMEAVRRLARAHHQLTVAMTASAVHVIGEDHVREAGAADIIGPGKWVDTPGLVHATDLVLIPTLSMNTAARLALGLMDSLFSTLALGALLAGKPVIAVRDGADPAGRGGEVFGAVPGASPALQARMLQNLDALQAYGVQLVREDGFLTAVSHHILHPGPAPAANGAASVAAHLDTAVAPNISTTILTDAELSGLPAGSVLRLGSGARLTPLAQDTAQRLRLQLLYE